MRVCVCPPPWSGTLILACSFLLSVLRPSLAQAAPTLPKAFEQHVKLDVVKMSMDDILEAITKQAHISILVDDEPMLKQADIAVDASLNDTLDKVADTFDYSWHVSKAGVVLMSKRFKNPNERPQMNMPEMLEMTRNIVRALTLVDYNRDEAQANEAVKRLFQTLTPVQMNALGAGTKLHGTDLAPDQRAAIEQAILTRTFAPPLKLWEDTISRLVNLKTSTLQARPRTPTPPTHDYFYQYLDADAKLHSFEIQHMVYGDNDGEIRTP
jgi:hypothetical protein